MNKSNTATVTPNKATTNGSPSAAAGRTASGPRHVHFVPHDAASTAEPPASNKAPGTSASALKKRTEKLGTHIVELIESQKPEPITTYISTLAMEMLAANAHVTDRATNAMQFDLSTATGDKWLPSNIKKIKIGLKASKLEGDDFYKQLDAECKDVVAKFKNDLNHIYYRLAIKEEENAREQRLLKFTTHAFALFQVYTKYYAEFADLGKLSRPLDTSAALFLSRFMKGYLKQNGFFGNASYLDIELQEALDALAAHVPGMNDPDTPLTPAGNPNSTTMGTKNTNMAAHKRDVYGYTNDENTVYKTIKVEVMKYFLQVTKEAQENIDKLRNETIQNAKLEAWLKAKQTEEATAACAAAIATIPTLLPNTMDALMETKATTVSTKVSEKVAKKETKAMFKQLAKQFGKNTPGGGKANPTPPTKGTRTEASGPKNKQQSGKKRKRQYNHDTTGKKPRNTEQQQKAHNMKGPPKNRPRPRMSNQKRKNGKGNQGEQHNAGRNGSTTRRR
jgi:hypothetical protein